MAAMRLITPGYIYTNHHPRLLNTSFPQRLKQLIFLRGLTQLIIAYLSSAFNATQLLFFMSAKATGLSAIAMASHFIRSMGIDRSFSSIGVRSYWQPANYVSAEQFFEREFGPFGYSFWPVNNVLTILLPNSTLAG
ncbi:hypothetical protein Nepgr_002853 [Nepenthes gracilis]|uniref:Uncharacterized protein n=1 Tax=Nepenthes gracilis TaxID=150966 RepID=A0AAD3PA44_NEPGR|nr:hypothetical protein Nepgr_002853 [Nepenthes gracilis]